MRKFHVLLLAVTLSASGPLRAQGIKFVGTEKTFTNCASGGSAAQTVSDREQDFFVRTSNDEPVWICLAKTGSTCVTGGNFLNANSTVRLRFSLNQLSVSCRSTGATGDLFVTPAG